MKNFLIVFLVFLAWSVFALWLYTWLEPKDPMAQSELNVVQKDIQPETDSRTLPLSEMQTAEPEQLEIDTTTQTTKRVIPTGIFGIDHNGNDIFSFPQGIRLFKNSPKIEIPTESKTYIESVKQYLLANPNKEVHVSMRYSPNENFESPNLGIQRGLMIKQQLVLADIPSERIIIKPVIHELDFDAYGTVQSTVTLTFAPFDPNKRSQQHANSSDPHSIIVYPNFSESGVLVNNQLRNTLTRIKEHLQQNPSHLVVVEGHTDNVGNANDNYKMGLTYAKQVRWYFVNKGGLAPEMVKATSQGESKAIASNNSEKGRTLNRRIEIIFEPIN